VTTKNTVVLCDTVEFGKNLPAVRRSLLQPLSGRRAKHSFAQKMTHISLYHTTPLHCLKIQYSSSSLSWGSQISLKFFHLVCRRLIKLLPWRWRQVSLILWQISTRLYGIISH